MKKFSVFMDFLLYSLILYLGGAQAMMHISPSLTTAEKYVNDTYIVTCSATNASWRNPSGVKITTTKGRIHVEELRAGELTLVFELIAMKDKGNYTCIATEDGEKNEAYFTLIVIKPISFMNTPRIQNATENTSTVVRCEVGGDPAPILTWQIRGKALEEPKYKKEPKGLLIKNVTLEDAGEYECRAFQLTSESSNMERLSITLKILHKPIWKSSNQAEKDMAYGYLSGTVNLTCEAIAEPEANFIWKRQGKQIKPQNYNATVIKETHRSILQLPIHNMSIFGEYECEAKNYLGRIERVIALEKGEKPEIPEVVTLRDTDVNAAILEIQSPGKDDDIIGYRVQFVEKLPGTEYTWDAPQYQDLTKTDGEYRVTDLLENTAYVVRVASRNAAGLSDYSPEVNLRTRKVVEETSGAKETTGSEKLLTHLIIIIASIYLLVSAH